MVSTSIITKNKADAKASAHSQRSPEGRWNIDPVAIAAGEADVQPSLLLGYFSMVFLLCQGENATFLFFQSLPQFFEGPFFDAGHIAPADSGGGGHFALTAWGIATEAVAQADDHSLLLGQAGVHGANHPLNGLPPAEGFQQVLVIADHIHQRQRGSVGAGFDIIRQGYVLTGFSLAAKMHENFIFHTSGSVGGQLCALGAVKGRDAFDQPDGADGNQVLLIRYDGVVFLARLKLEEGKTASNLAPSLR